MRLKWFSRGICLLVGVLAAYGAAVAVRAHSNESRGDWPMFGQNLANTGSIETEDGISTRNVRALKKKWSFDTGGDVSARAAVVDKVAYFPDWGGNLFALKAETGKVKWSRQLSTYGLTGSSNGVYHSRTSPAVDDDVVYIGTQEGAWLLAISAKTGRLIWKTQLRAPAEDPYAMITASPVVSDGVVYTGIASNEEGLSGFVPGFPCCNARGSVVAVDAVSGNVIWETYMVPPGYTGGGVWGSNFVVDTERRTVFVGTGNNYSHPTAPAYLACISAGGTAAACNAPNNYVDAVVALSLRTGHVRWAKKLVTWSQPGVTDGSDDWNVACIIPPFANCPSSAGPDYDFASAPNLITYKAGRRTKTILGAGQKSGIYFALDPDTGAELWHTQVGPGSSLGGMEWGSATDGKRIYVSIANLYGIPSAAGNAGSWAALDPETGAILWQKADPNGAITLGPVTVANDVVFVSSMAGAATAPTMLALNAATGNTLWQFAAGSSVNAGASVVDDTVFWGSGYAHLGIPGYTGAGSPNVTTKFYAFTTK